MQIIHQIPKDFTLFSLNYTQLVIIIFLFLAIKASRPFGGEFEKVWMKTETLLLSSLPQGPVRPPGNGCTNTGNGGNPCIGSRKLVGRVGGVAAPTQLLATHTNL
ncbi:hypothetical protein Tco_0085323 [Tanacetum coccineum]